MITTKEMLRRMDAGEVFAIQFVSYDRKRPLHNGRIIEYAEAVLLSHRNEVGTAPEPGSRPPTTREAANIALATRPKSQHDNYTRTVCIMQEGLTTSVIKDFHPPLVLRFNNEPVL